MTIISVSFVAFTLIVLCLYYIVPPKFQNHVLLIASYLFLVSWSVQFALVYACLTTIDYVLALYLVEKPAQRQKLLYLGVFLNVLALIFFKYSNFFIPSFMDSLQQSGLNVEFEIVSVVLPLGLSFFIVQAISYLFDVNSGVVKPVANPITFALYMVYFPKLVSGPIERIRSFVPLLEHPRTLNGGQIGDGLVFLLQGLIRKIVIADMLSIIIPANLFTQPQNFSAPDLTLWLVAYAIALYNDFAGYTLIVRAVSNFFGIPLSENFNIPYFAHSFTEFWRRWHITLSNWLRDYIFMPTMRFLLKRKYSPTSVVCIVVPPAATLFVSALWHNASLNMLVWGALHSLYLIGERVYNLKRPTQLVDTQSAWRQLAGISTVFLLTLLAWVPFKADLPSTLQYWSGMLSPVNWYDALVHPAIFRHTIDMKFGFDLLILIGLSISLDLAHYRFGEQGFRKLPIPLQAVAINLALFMVIAAVMAQNAPPPFAYQGF